MIESRLATRIVEALQDGDLLYVARDEQQAEVLALAVAAAAPGHDVIWVPASDALPGDDTPATPSNAGQRVAALRRLRRLMQAGDRAALACIASAEATARPYPAPEAYDFAPPLLVAGAPLDPAGFAEELERIGYVADDRVDEPGEVAVRGEVIDIFPADAELPARVDLAEGRIAAIRSYDPISQRSVAELDRLEVGRASEPLVGEGAVALLDHLRPATLVFDAQAEDRRTRFLALAEDAARHGGRSAAIPPERWGRSLAQWQRVEWPDDAEAVLRFVERRAPIAAFQRVARPLLADGGRLVLAGGERDLRFLRRRVARVLNTEAVELHGWAEARALPRGGVGLLHMPATAGFRHGDLLLVAAADLLGSRAALEDQGPQDASALLGSGEDIRVGDVVIHEDHGIALVAGLELLPGEAGSDAIVLEYAEGARRLVPVDTADRIWRYGADADAVTLDKLDGSSWQKRRGAIDAAIAESARGLAALAAERAKRAAAILEPDPAAYERFAAGFPFTETADQSRAIAAVREDLASGRPMDRLVIGDVGYGKTEVALRAAAMVALAGGQVAVAAPTTVLVRQHIETFARRFEGTGVTVAGLSRLSSAAEKKAVKAGLADGSIGVVIGTGAVAAKDVRYKSLGLVVIDEEQRFGAADKTRLRGGGDTHVLTLSATPIPRTLQTALVGLQQLSIIATPPARRQPIRTTLDSWDDTKVRVALMREKARGGQSFVVVPRIEDMAPIAERLARIVPQLRIIDAHGKMPAAELDEAMVRFAGGNGDVLLATNIIEAGLDVPRANTMLVWRADRFGLSQLHQLRGRVGRGSRRGQVLLLTDGEATVAESTLKRLRTLQAFDRLGAGFAISARDLDMRGAGDLLGEAQAGHMKLIGVDLYQHLLEAALRQARGEDVERWTPELNLGATGSLPADWIPEPEIRASLYARLARIDDGNALDAFEEELEDRFGALPGDAQRLVAMARLRCLARAAGIARIDAGPAAIAFTPRRDFAGDSGGLEQKGERLILAERIEDEEARLARVGEVLEGWA